MKIKLPRKRKKAFKKISNNYATYKMLLEICFEDDSTKQNTRFYKLKTPNKKEIKKKNQLLKNGYFIVKRY